MDIMAAILEVAQDGALKTRIMYHGFLSFPQLKQYLELMIDSGLLEYSEVERKYHTTAKGRHFLKLHGEIREALVPAAVKIVTH